MSKTKKSSKELKEYNFYTEVSAFEGLDPMLVFVVVGGHDYEGYSTPIGVASTLESAWNMLNECTDSYDYKTVFKYLVDGSGQGPLQEISS